MKMTDKAGMNLLVKIAANEAMHRHWNKFQDDPDIPSKCPFVDETQKMRQKNSESLCIRSHVGGGIRKTQSRGSKKKAHSHRSANWHDRGADRACLLCRPACLRIARITLKWRLMFWTIDETLQTIFQNQKEIEL